MLDRLITRTMARPPDLVIGGTARPYLRRWFVIPKNPLFNIYLHEVLRSDDDGALHDHPWFNVSIILRGWYIEHTIRAGGIHVRRVRRAFALSTQAAPEASPRREGLRLRERAGAVKLRTPWAAHRLEVSAPCLTLFLTGPRLRAWGFHCPEAGWRHWRDFTSPADSGAIGPSPRRRGFGPAGGRGCE